MDYSWAFLPMVASNDLLDDPEALQARMDEDGYLYFPQVLDRQKILRLRRRMLETLRAVGWVPEDSVLMRGKVTQAPVREGDPEFFAAYDEIQKLEEFHTLAHDEDLLRVVHAVLGPTAWPHPLKIARLMFPEHYAVTTPPHQDFPNNQGTTSLTATWVPVGDIDGEMGGLAILRGSHKWGELPLATHLGPGNRCAVLPPDMLEQCRWVSTSFQAGDVLLFGSLTVHAARHNFSPDFMRLSVDFRYQRAGEALTPGCLEPHFGRLSWEEIYAGWKSKKHQYYWRDLGYTVEEFVEIPVPQTEPEAKVLLQYEHRMGARAQRRGEPVSSG